jgi:hypothetical protein
MSQKAKMVLLVSALSLCYPVSEEVFRSWNYFPAQWVKRRGKELWPEGLRDGALCGTIFRCGEWRGEERNCDQNGCETEHCVELVSGVWVERQGKELWTERLRDGALCTRTVPVLKGNTCVNNGRIIAFRQSGKYTFNIIPSIKIKCSAALYI